MERLVYARDYYCDELYNEYGNWCATNCKVQVKPDGTFDIDYIIKAMVDEDQLIEPVSIDKTKVTEDDVKSALEDVSKPDTEWSVIYNSTTLTATYYFSKDYNTSYSYKIK